MVTLAERFPAEFTYFANELPDLPETRAVLEKFLTLGAKGIGEQKFPVACDSQAMQLVYSIAREFDVPVLLHFQHERYNTGIERFHTIVERFPTVNFIGHAQTWWGNIDRNHDQSVMYPKTPVQPGGITDRLLSDYPNVYGDLSAGSGPELDAPRRRPSAGIPRTPPGSPPLGKRLQRLGRKGHGLHRIKGACRSAASGTRPRRDCEDPGRKRGSPPQAQLAGMRRPHSDEAGSTRYSGLNM